MDDDVIDALNTPIYANLEELQKLNLKADRVIELLEAIRAALGSHASVRDPQKPL